MEAKFGYYPYPLSIRIGTVEVDTLPNLEETVARVTASNGVHSGWIYAPPQTDITFEGKMKRRPHSSRVFGLPKTHSLRRAGSDSDDHVAYLIWVLSFCVGMRLTATEAGYLDATPIKPGKLVDFVASRDSLAKTLLLADAFWTQNDEKRSLLLVSAIHALFLAQTPQYLQFERIIYLSASLDACYRLASSIYPSSKCPGYTARIRWICDLFSIATPSWANPQGQGEPEFAAIRNAAVHEAILAGQPLGFAVHHDDSLFLEAEALICRFIVALLGAPNAEYVGTSISTRQLHGLDL